MAKSEINNNKITENILISKIFKAYFKNMCVSPGHLAFHYVTPSQAADFWF